MRLSNNVLKEEQIEFQSDVQTDLQNEIHMTKLDKVIFTLLLMLLGITPLIIMAGKSEVVSPLILSRPLFASQDFWDIFAYYKAFFTLVITGILTILFLYKIIFKKESFRKTPLNIILIVFIFTILLSTIFSPTISIAMEGLFNRYDGAIRWVCYLTILFIAMNSRYPKNVSRSVSFALYPFVVINLFIITMNFTGHDLLQYEWMRDFLYWYWPIYNLSEDSIILGTLNQWNFMSGMFGIMTVLFLTFTITEKSVGIRISHFIITIFSMIVLLLSTSTSGFVTVLTLLPFLIIVGWKSLKRNQNLLLILLFCICTVLSSFALSKENERVWNESFGYFSIDNLQKVFSALDYKKPIQEETQEEQREGFELPVLPEPGSSAGSGRTYIWEKTLELVKERPVLGYGLDTLFYNFPHFNIDARAGLRRETVYVDKPHNTFIGVLYGVGILGFICYLLIFVFLCKIIWSSIKERSQTVLPFVFATLAFFVQGIFNDSTPEISTAAWTLFGIAIALYYNKRDDLSN